MRQPSVVAYTAPPPARPSSTASPTRRASALLKRSYDSSEVAAGCRMSCRCPSRSAAAIFACDLTKSLAREPGLQPAGLEQREATWQWQAYGRTACTRAAGGHLEVVSFLCVLARLVQPREIDVTRRHPRHHTCM